MSYKPVMKQDYDKKVKFHRTSLFCYSKKQFKKINKQQQIRVIGEITGKTKNDCEEVVEINEKPYLLFEPGDKSRILYREVGWLCNDEGSYVVVLKNRLPIFLLILLLAVIIASVIWFAFFRQPADPVVIPPSVDPNVSVIEGDNDSEKMEAPEGGGAVRLTYSLDAILTFSTGDIRMYFQNPNVSTQNIALTLYLLNGEEQIKIAESGMIEPGYGLSSMEFIENSAVLSVGTYEALYVVSFFDPETGEKALVESNITDVRLQVQ